MKQFAELVTILATSTKTNDKLKALENYFSTADDKDKVWVIALFSGRRPKRIVNSSLLHIWCSQLTDIPLWLFEECYHTVGDLGETIALILTGNKSTTDNYPLWHYLETLKTLEKADEKVKKEFIADAWGKMSQHEIFVFNKLIAGSFRIGVSQKSMVNSLAKSVNLSPSVIAHHISGNWDPSTTLFDELLSEEHSFKDISKPYPFYLAYALDAEPATLGQPHEWSAEWKWDGIRGQIIKRNNELFVWSRGEELITDKFPEYFILKDLLPEGTVLDGEILPFRETMPLSFNILQTRIGRKNVTRKNLDEAPVAFFAYDLLEYEGNDWRERTLKERRAQLEHIVESVNNAVLKLSPIINFNSWDDLAAIRLKAREVGSEGLMLKRRSSAYLVGRKVGDWWKWKIDPLTIDAVMIYAQKGHGRRSNLYTDYTFAVKDGERLVSFAKAYSGLTDKEFAEVDSFVKRNSIEKFGPVRTVKPELVFEIAFEGIAKSSRHKSGVALRFPRIYRWRKDKTVNDINTLDDLKKLLNKYEIK
ncbi:ATP-dependent DNA ligase [Ferruginibacter albus]|uniref:ATP-dependent DNA ligase n=1 Tax=Ferruginibacter albus TaxID=2875540 RepID=UPI001CC62407|nr:ATP-dependent DNA ligase [Ferruginibacter albus]UAY51226.1 ATP-dependent DNA ligase [Ferruginibacter albus]